MTSVKKIFCLWLAWFIAMPSMAQAAQPPKHFQDYAAASYSGLNKPLILNKESRRYRTLLAALAKQPPNFAGHYVMNTVGCGGGCSFAVAYNAKTGHGFLFSDPVSDCYNAQDGFTANDIEFRLDSQLVKSVGRRGAAESCEVAYYIVDNNEFKQIE